MLRSLPFALEEKFVPFCLLRQISSSSLLPPIHLTHLLYTFPEIPLPHQNTFPGYEPHQTEPFSNILRPLFDKGEAKDFEPLIVTIDKDFEKAARQVLLQSNLLIEIQELPEILGTLCKIDAVNSSLQAIVDLPISATLSQQRFRDFANVLLSANKEIERVINLFNQLAKDGISLYDRFGTLLQKLKESSHDQVVNCIKFAANTASDSIEDFLTGHPFLLEKEDLLKLPAMQIHPQKGLKNIFDLLKLPAMEIHPQKGVMNIRKVTSNGDSPSEAHIKTR